jgi:hypothetical protein
LILLISSLTGLLIAVGVLEFRNYLGGFQTRRQKVVILSLSVIFHLGILETFLAIGQATANSWVSFLAGIWEWMGLPIMTGLIFVARSLLYRNRFQREETNISELSVGRPVKARCPHCGGQISIGDMPFPFWEFMSVDRLEPIPNSMQCPYCSYLIPADSTIKPYLVADMNRLAGLSDSEKKRFAAHIPLWIPVASGLIAIALSCLYLYGGFTLLLELMVSSLAGLLAGLWVGIRIGRRGHAIRMQAFLKKPALYKSSWFPFWDLTAIPLLLTILWMTGEFPLLIFLVWSLAILVFTIAFYARREK